MEYWNGLPEAHESSLYVIPNSVFSDIMLLVQNPLSLGLFTPQRSADTKNQGSPVPFHGQLLQFTSTSLLVIFCDVDHTQKVFIGRKICLLLWESHQFNLWLFRDCGILGSTLNSLRCYCCRLLTMSITHLCHWLNIWMFCFPVTWLSGWSFSKNYRSVPYFELLRKGPHSPRKSVLSCLSRWVCSVVGHAWAGSGSGFIAVRV